MLPGTASQGIVMDDILGSLAKKWPFVFPNLLLVYTKNTIL